MQAVVLSRFGGPESLHTTTVACPVIRPDQMLVRVAACGVCGHDVLNRRGAFPGTRLPAVLGHEIAGTVEHTGDQIHAFRPGDRVALLQRLPCGECRACRDGRENLCRRGEGFYGEELSGGYGAFVVASTRNAVALPIEVPFSVGAVLSCALGTGYHALQRARVRPGDSVVITGASGGVGIHTVQIARLMGLRTVAIAASPAKVPALRVAGADEVLVAPEGEFHDGVRALTDGEGAAAVVEIAGTPTFASSVRCLRSGGRLVLVGNVRPGNVALNPAFSILKELELIGSGHACASELRQVIDLVVGARLNPVIAQTMPVAEAVEAHRLMESRNTTGRLVLIHA